MWEDAVINYSIMLNRRMMKVRPINKLVRPVNKSSNNSNTYNVMSDCHSSTLCLLLNYWIWLVILNYFVSLALF